MISKRKSKSSAITVFIAGPFNHFDKDTVDKRVKAMAHYATYLLEKSRHICPISPVLTGTKILDHFNLSTSFDYWDRISYQYIDLCDEIHVLCLPGWDTSRGVAEELKHAKKFKKKIIYITHEKGEYVQHSTRN